MISMTPLGRVIRWDLGEQRQQFVDVLECVRTENVFRAVLRKQIERLVQIGDDIDAVELDLV
jgi:hypothetical protein